MNRAYGYDIIYKISQRGTDVNGKNNGKNKKIWLRVLFAIALFLYIAIEVVIVHVFNWKFMENPLTVAAPTILFVFSFLCDIAEKPKGE